MAKKTAEKNEPAPASGQVPLPMVNAAFKLWPRQQSVYDALLGKTNQCAQMYLGAVMVLADANNPERLYLAAHSLREFMNNIGPFLEVPVLNPELKKANGKLGDKFRKIENLVAKAEKNSPNWDGKKWSGKIHKHTEAVLIEIQKCAEWRKENEKQRKTNSGAILKKFDPLHDALPQEIQSLHIREWEETRDYFVKVAHRATTDLQELNRWLLHLEEMLLKGLIPRTEQNLAEMDAIIKAGETK